MDNPNFNPNQQQNPNNAPIQYQQPQGQQPPQGYNPNIPPYQGQYPQYPNQFQQPPQGYNPNIPPYQGQYPQYLNQFQQPPHPQPSKKTYNIAKYSLIGMIICSILLIVCTDTIYVISIFFYHVFALLLLLTLPTHVKEKNMQETGVASGGCVTAIGLFIFSEIIYCISTFIHYGVHY